MKKIFAVLVSVLLVCGLTAVIISVVSAQNDESVVEATAVTEESTEASTEAEITVAPTTEPTTETATKSTEPAKKTATDTNVVPSDYYTDESYNGNSSDQHVVSYGSDGSVSYEVQKTSRSSSSSATPLPQAGSNVKEESETSAAPQEVVEYSFPEPQQDSQPETVAEQPQPQAGGSGCYTVYVGDTTYTIPYDEFDPSDWVGFDVVG